MSETSSARAAAFAPATVGNIGVGFDILGHAIDAVGDTVTVTRRVEPGVRITTVSGVVDDLPREPEKNTATLGLLRLIDHLELDFGFEVAIEKGIPMGSGMGGSAASAVAAVAAANALVDQPLERAALLTFALEGESLTGGDTVHADNVAPALFGGIVLSSVDSPPAVTRIPVPSGLTCVLGHPDIVVETRASRGALSDNVSRADFVRQTSNLAGVIAGCFSNDLALIEKSLEDVIIEPQRAGVIPGFNETKRRVLEAGALGCSISGSGPSVFAWCTQDTAQPVAGALRAGFEAAGVDVRVWTSPVAAPGVRVLET